MSERLKLELSAIYEISKVLASNPDLRKSLRSALVILNNFFEMKRGVVALKKGDMVEIVSSFGLSRDEVKRGRYKLGEGVIGKVAKNGTPIVIPNVTDDEVFLNKTRSRPAEEKAKISFICVPIKIKSDVLGVLSVDKNFDRNTKFEDDIKLLKTVATLFAINIQLNSYYESEITSLIEQRDQLISEMKERYRLENVVSNSEKMQIIFETIHMVAKTKASVLILGESGTGKELLARSIHFLSNRKDKPFISLNCSAIPENLIESELFGHEKGAFTGAINTRKGKFELADGGTIFLDEIGDLPLHLQPKLLRVLQEMEFERVGGSNKIKVDVRVIAATNRNLTELIREDKFREDLYFRLNVIPIQVPPLRERKEDIPILIEHFLERFNSEHKRKARISEKAMERLVDYNWPGNVRELENTIERLVLMSKKDLIDENDIPINIRKPKQSVAMELSYNMGLPKLIKELEREHITKALESTRGNRKKAAQLLGLTERQINYKIEKLNINI